MKNFKEPSIQSTESQITQDGGFIIDDKEPLPENYFIEIGEQYYDE